MAEDPELERKLEAMFASARPRSAFEDELWRRIEARRPWYQRLGRQLRPALRYAPALATLLVVALGATWLAGNFHGRLGAGSTTTSGAAPAFGDKNASLPPAFGVLPRLGGGLVDTAPQATTGGAAASAGQRFSGTPPTLPAELPVYRYDEPSAADLARIDAELKARSGLATINVTPSDAAHGIEPQFLFVAPAGSAAQGGAAADTATAFLSGHNLLPSFAYQVSAVGGRVVYGRVFDRPGGSIRQVQPDATAAGLTVDVNGGNVLGRGPLDLPLTIASYPLRSANDAIAAANLRPGATAGALDHAELVYVLVVSGGHGYYEPELLLTGQGEAVLAPVIAPRWLAR
jgi:hypothetical protein